MKTKLNRLKQLLMRLIIRHQQHSK